MRTCNHPNVYIGYRATPKDAGEDGLLIEGDEGWGWYSGGKFGCVLFEEKDS
jgi:hypothetical protein